MNVPGNIVSNRDEVDYIEALEAVRAVLVEGRRMGAVDFFIGVDVNIDLSCVADGHRGPGSVEWYGMYGLECEGTADDIIVYEKKFKWFQRKKDFNCTVTSTWTNNEDSCEFHTWRAWRSGGRKKQLDYIMGPKDLRSVTWYLNQVRIRTWDHFLVITRVDGREIGTKMLVKGWAGWTPVSEGEMAKFQALVLYPRDTHDEAASCETEDGEGLVLLHDSCCRDQSYHDLVKEPKKICV